MPYDLLEDLLPQSGAWRQAAPLLLPHDDIATGRPTSDHDYVRILLKHSIEELSDHPELPDDDGSDCAEAIDEYWKRRSSLN